ncbi:MAG TPA: glycosyltransferase, partial [Thermoanaerobaculia bacterium]
MRTHAAWNGLESRLGVPYPVFSPSLWPGLLRELRRCDVLHAHGMLSEASFAALMLARYVTSTPSVLTEHVGHVPFRRSWLNAVETAAIGTMGRMAARSASAIVVLNPEVHSLMARLAPGRDIRTIRNGIDLSRYRPAEASERRRLRQDLGWDEVPRVLFVGRLV